MYLNQFRWIDDKYKIDFEIPKLLKNTIEEAEELDRSGDMEYFDVADTIDVICKNFVSSHTMTKEQWDIVTKRYKIGRYGEIKWNFIILTKHHIV